MGLLPEDIVSQIPPLRTQDRLPDSELIAYARLTIRAIGMTWFLLDLHSDQDVFTGYLIDSQKEQFGIFSIDYTDEVLDPFQLELDSDFTPKPLIDAVREERILRFARGEELHTIGSPLAEHRAYYYVYSYTCDAREVYEKLRKIVLRVDVLGEEMNLSVFHLLPSAKLTGWHIVIMGDRPQEHIHEEIMNAVSEGTLTTIPYGLLMQLFIRKVEANQIGPVREYHRDIQLRRRPSFNP